MAKDLFIGNIFYKPTGHKQFIVIRSATLWERLRGIKLVAVIPVKSHIKPALVWPYKNWTAFCAEWGFSRENR